MYFSGYEKNKLYWSYVYIYVIYCVGVWFNVGSCSGYNCNLRRDIFGDGNW